MNSFLKDAHGVKIRKEQGKFIFFIQITFGHKMSHSDFKNVDCRKSFVVKPMLETNITYATVEHMKVMQYKCTHKLMTTRRLLMNEINIIDMTGARV